MTNQTLEKSQKILLETRGGGDVTSDTQIMPLETMPAADDDQTTLTTGNISQILENVGDDVISKLQVLFGVIR